MVRVEVNDIELAGVVTVLMIGQKVRDKITMIGILIVTGLVNSERWLRLGATFNNRQVKKNVVKKCKFRYLESQEKT